MAKYDLPKIRKGDTFDGVQFTININETPADLTGASIKMDLRLTALGDVVKRFTSSDGITISATPTDGTFVLDQQIISIDAATYMYDIEITFQSGEVKTYIWGNWVIVQDVTYDT